MNLLIFRLSSLRANVSSALEAERNGAGRRQTPAFLEGGTSAHVRSSPRQLSGLTDSSRWRGVRRRRRRKGQNQQPGSLMHECLHSNTAQGSNVFFVIDRAHCTVGKHVLQASDVEIRRDVSQRLQPGAKAKCEFSQVRNIKSLHTNKEAAGPLVRGPECGPARGLWLYTDNHNWYRKQKPGIIASERKMKEICITTEKLPAAWWRVCQSAVLRQPFVLRSHH